MQVVFGIHRQSTKYSLPKLKETGKRIRQGKRAPKDSEHETILEPISLCAVFAIAVGKQ